MDGFKWSVGAELAQNPYVCFGWMKVHHSSKHILFNIMSNTHHVSSAPFMGWFNWRFD
jgi:hypothetical protein